MKIMGYPVCVFLVKVLGKVFGGHLELKAHRILATKFNYRVSYYYAYKEYQKNKKYKFALKNLVAYLRNKDITFKDAKDLQYLSEKIGFNKAHKILLKAMNSSLSSGVECKNDLLFKSLFLQGKKHENKLYRVRSHYENNYGYDNEVVSYMLGIQSNKSLYAAVGNKKYLNIYDNLADLNNIEKNTKINFVHTDSKNYAGVQRQLVELIGNKLPKGAWGCTEKLKLENSVNITFFNRQDADVLMSHGVADKNYFTRKAKDGSMLLDNFEYGFVPGNWLRSRLIDHPQIAMPDGNIHIVGWPRLDVLSNMRKSYKNSDKLKVLWAPTHNFQTKTGKVLSSYPEFEKYVDILEDRYDFSISLHPRNRADKTPTVDKLAQCDVLISDFGTMVYEALALDIPVIFPDWVIRENILSAYSKTGPAQLFIQDVGYHPDSIDELVDILDSGPVVDIKTKKFIDNVIDPSTVGVSSEITARKLLELSEAKV